jgi:hypothetical protein
MIQVLSQKNVWSLPAGTVIRVNCGLYDHVALLGDRLINGERSVLSFSAQTRGLAEMGVSAFAGGRAVTIDGYLGSQPPEWVIWRARLKFGQGYSWTEFNCEHFVRYAHGVLPESPQLHKLGFLGGLLSVVALVSLRAG